MDRTETWEKIRYTKELIKTLKQELAGREDDLETLNESIADSVNEELEKAREDNETLKAQVN